MAAGIVYNGDMNTNPAAAVVHIYVRATVDAVRTALKGTDVNAICIIPDLNPVIALVSVPASASEKVFGVMLDKGIVVAQVSPARSVPVNWS